MHNQIASIYSSASHAPSDIVKAIKGSIVAAPPPTYKGEKILRRTGTSITSNRHADDWKGHFHRREEHKSKGFFSQITQPYKELGGAELDNKKLVLKALTDIGRIFECKTEMSFKRYNRNEDDYCDMTDLEKRQGRDKNHRFYKYEVSGNGFEAVREILDEGGKKITWIKAGRPLYQLLEENVKESTEDKKVRNKNNSTWDESDLESTGHVLKEATNTKLGSLVNREPDSRVRGRFLAKVEAINVILCCILNMKSKELRNRNPLAPEVLKSLKKEVSLDAAQAMAAKQRMPTMPLPHHIANRQKKLSNGTLAESRMSGPTSISAGKEAFLSVSNEDLRSIGSRCRPNTGYASVRSSIGPHATSRGKGAFFMNKRDSELPIWQKVVQEDARKEEVVRKPRKTKKKKQLGNVEKIPELAKKAFDKMKTKNSNKLLRELDTRMGYFRQRLHCLDVSIAEIAIKNMRSRVKDEQSRKNFDLSWLKSWYETLREEQRHLSLENDKEVSDKLEGLKRFSNMALSTIPHHRAKLCLLVMSLPVYELCTMPMQEGLKFVLSSIMVSSESSLEDWMVSRKLITSNTMSD